MKKYLVYSIISLILLMTFSSLVAADDKGELMGKISLNKQKQITINSEDYIPLEKVADLLDYEQRWSLNANKVNGYINDKYFSSEDYIIAYGRLYLPKKFYESKFNMKISIRGNNYFIYIIKNFPYEDEYDLELDINTDKKVYKHNEPIAVSILLINKSEENQTLKFNSSQKYDIILRKNNRVIWKLSENKGHLPAISFQEIKADDYLLFTEIIKPEMLKPGESTPILYGHYTLEVEIKTLTNNILSQNIELEFD